MSSHPPARLTKKQRKATAFRERGSKRSKEGKGKGKGKPNPAPPGHHPRLGQRRSSTGDNDEGYYGHHDEDEEEDEEDANAVPAMEDQDQAMAEMARDTEADAKVYGTRDAARLRKAAVGSTPAQKKVDGDMDKDTDGKKKKRSRGADHDGEARPASKKKRARLSRGSDEVPPTMAHKADGDGDCARRMSDDEGGDGSETEDKGGKQQRYILFVGNLKYTTTRETIQDHFSQCDPPPTVRLLTPKLTRPGATVTKSKGCAFLEFSTRSTLQTALRMHQSELDGRRINVELTAGGGGKGNARLAKVKARNKGLSAQRTRRTVKKATAEGMETTRHEALQSQRFSTTSGEGEVPRTKRTWTVGDEDQGGMHRGGKKAGRKRGARTKNLGTGVNALPIG